MVIHNAAFDMKFLNAELEAIQKPKLPWEQAIDTLDMARRKFPGAQNTLDGLSRRFGISIERDLHGALLDSQILAAVYLELIGGRQPDFALGIVGGTDTNTVTAGITWAPHPRPKTLPPRTTEAEKENHKKFIETLGPDAAWLK
jgi:DNA polymerase-3 subunit epsilon